MVRRFALAPVAVVLMAACLRLPGFLLVPAPEVGAVAPDFTWANLNGASVGLSELRGQVVLINFWATWCVPCRVEMPAIQARYNDGDFAVLAVNFDESAEKVRAFADELGLDFPILLDPGGKIQELYRVRGYPSSYFVDTNGVIQFIHIGEMSNADLDNYLSQLGLQP